MNCFPLRCAAAAAAERIAKTFTPMVKRSSRARTTGPFQPPQLKETMQAEFASVPKNTRSPA
jgi:hypothetical protein